MVRVVRLLWRADVVAKLGSKHGVSLNDVEEACWDHQVKARWDLDPERGRRLLIDGRTESGRRLRVILRPTDTPGEFWVVSAF